MYKTGELVELLVDITIGKYTWPKGMKVVVSHCTPLHAIVQLGNSMEAVGFNQIVAVATAPSHTPLYKTGELLELLFDVITPYQTLPRGLHVNVVSCSPSSVLVNAPYGQFALSYNDVGRVPPNKPAPNLGAWHQTANYVAQQAQASLPKTFGEFQREWDNTAKCECGVSAVGGGRHSSYCPLSKVS